MLRKFFIIGVAMTVFSGCQSENELTETTALVRTDLALSLTAASPSALTSDAAVNTRQSASVVQTDGARSVQLLNISPFSKRGTITTEDRPSYYELGGSELVFNKPSDNAPTRKFYYREQFFFMPGAASFLVYGKATPVKIGDAVDKAANGWLRIFNGGSEVSALPRLVVPADLQFKLEPISGSNEVPDEAKRLAGYLTYIAGAYGQVGSQTVTWEGCSDSWLKALYLNFINKGNQGTVAPLAGSARNVRAFVSRLYQVMAGNTFASGTMEKAIAEAVMARIAGTVQPESNYANGTRRLTITFDAGTVTSLGIDYPGALPDGAAVLLWNNKTGNAGQFEPQMETTTMANINSVSRYAYPAELYYYANSRIKTHNEPVGSENYSSATDWSGVLDLYAYDDAIITTSTQAAVIKEPLQYGVACLQATVQASTAELTDANGDKVTVGGMTFPIRGIIVSNQRPVGFDFTPVDNSDVEVSMVYDNQLYSSGTTPFYLSASEARGPLNTLVLQSWGGEDVPVILELENNSGQSFKGSNGMVYPGTRFYLVGLVEMSKATGSGSDDYRQRVFTRDHTTVVGMTVSSLAHAYNVLPNLLTGRLEIGVQITTDWQQATPSSVVME